MDYYQIENGVAFICIWLAFIVSCLGVWALIIWLFV